MTRPAGPRPRRRLRIGVLEILTPAGRPDGLLSAHRHLIARQYASIMPQAVSVWCRRRGHATSYATYYGQRDPVALLPRDLDAVFLSTYTRASPLAYALATLLRRAGVWTALAGPHAKAFPEDCLRFADAVVQECDETLLDELVRDRPRGVLVTSGRALRAVPSVEERLPEITQASFWRGRPMPTSVIGLLASVGCPYRCDFCTDWDNPYVPLSADDLAADLRFVRARLPATKVAFHDPNFAVDFDRVMTVLEAVPGNARPGYLVETSLSTLRGSRLPRLGATGCWYLAAGVESWADYSNKTAAGPRAVGTRKLDAVVAHCEAIAAHVPIVQANFVFGIDGDRGDEPLALTREFVRRAPFVWPNVCIPTPFGNTPLYDRHRREGAVLETMPFAFYNLPYLVTRPRHYAPTDYYDRLVGVFEEILAPARVRARLRVHRGVHRIVNGLRLLGLRRVRAELRAIRDRLHREPSFRAFHEGASRALPAFYARRFDALLGPYAALLGSAERTPVLPEPGASLAASSR